MAETLSLGGRNFTRVTETTVEHDLYLMMHSRHAGLVGMVPREGEDPEAFVLRMLDGCLSSGRALLLLGGLLLPEGKAFTEWSESVALETAAHLGRITDHDQKGEVYNTLASGLLGFFDSGLYSWISSPRASSGDVGGQTGKSPPPL